MELREFVKTTLLDVIGAVVDAGREMSKDERYTGAFINPTTVVHEKRVIAHYSGGLSVHDVSFDVAVTAEKSSQGKAGIAVVFSAIGVGGQKANASSDSTVSRIRFSIPVAYPPTR